MGHKEEAINRGIRPYETIVQGSDELRVQVAMTHALLYLGEQLEQIRKLLEERGNG